MKDGLIATEHGWFPPSGKGPNITLIQDYYRQMKSGDRVDPYGEADSFNAAPATYQAIRLAHDCVMYGYTFVMVQLRKVNPGARF